MIRSVRPTGANWNPLTTTIRSSWTGRRTWNRTRKRPRKRPRNHPRLGSGRGIILALEAALSPLPLADGPVGVARGQCHGLLLGRNAADVATRDHVPGGDREGAGDRLRDATLRTAHRMVSLGLDDDHLGRVARMHRLHPPAGHMTTASRRLMKTRRAFRWGKNDQAESAVEISTNMKKFGTDNDDTPARSSPVPRPDSLLSRA